MSGPEVTEMRVRLAYGVVLAVVLAGLIGVVGPAGASTPTVSKTTNLGFYEQVTVHIEDQPGSEIFVDQCFVQGGSTVLGCGGLVRARVPATGVLDAPAVLMRRLETHNPTTGVTSILDCTTAGITCNVTTNVPTIGVIPLTFDASAPVPTVSVTPSSNLGWTANATVHGSGFPPGQELWVTECARSSTSTEPIVHCAGVKHEPHAVADGSGSFSFPTTVRRLLAGHGSASPDPSGSADCVQPGVECFERVVLPPVPGETDRNALYANGPIDTPLAFNDDGIPVVLVKTSIRQQEHHTAVKISVDLTGPASSPLIVEYTTATVPAGVGIVPATPGSDFVAKTSRLHFLPGETHHVIWITLVDDQVSEPDELFAVKLAGAFHANRRSIPILITNDDH
jgi:hypothetical protein